MVNKNKISVCFSTENFLKYADKKSIVIIVDLLRATSVISTAFECGVKEIIPVKTLEEALKFKDYRNHIIAGERNTLPVEGFEYGNSPYHYLNSNVEGKTLVLTTTNGTKAIHLAKDHKVITASFLNIDSVTRYLTNNNNNNNLIILCSGWKGFFNLEDAIFAGALSKKILDTNTFISNCDSLYASIQLYLNSKQDLFAYLEKSSYRKRNNSNEIIKDTKFCLNPPIKSSVIPILKNDRLIKIIDE